MFGRSLRRAQYLYDPQNKRPLANDSGRSISRTDRPGGITNGRGRRLRGERGVDPGWYPVQSNATDRAAGASGSVTTLVARRDGGWAYADWGAYAAAPRVADLYRSMRNRRLRHCATGARTITDSRKCGPPPYSNALLAGIAGRSPRSMLKGDMT